MPTLGEWVEAVRAVTPDRVAEWVAAGLIVAVPLALDGVAVHFRDAVGPGGVPWAALAHPRGGGKAGRPLDDTGGLKRSVTAVASGPSLTLATDHVGARLMQEGGEVRPVNGLFLAIPNPDDPQAVAAKSPRNYPGELVPAIRGDKTGGVLYAEGDGPGSKRPGWHAAYFLTTLVEVPARPFLYFDDAMIQAILEVVLEKVVWNWLGVGSG